MKSTTLPVICVAALTAMSAAGISHWWSVRQFVSAVDSGLPVQAAPARPSQPAPSPVPERRSKPTPDAGKPIAPILAGNQRPAGQVAQQKDFYEALINRMESLQNQNRDLLDQLAETNRDIMKLEFRVDTHSESFRPLAISEERLDTSLDTSFEDEPGVLPPRAEPVMLPAFE
jgi:hypothetical protein